MTAFLTTLNQEQSTLMMRKKRENIKGDIKLLAQFILEAIKLMISILRRENSFA